MDARKMFLAFGVLALGAGLPLTVSRADAAPACGHSACSDEVAAAGLSGASRAACFKTAIAACQAGACSCTSTGSDACVCTPAGGSCSCSSLAPTTTTSTTTSTTTTLFEGGCSFDPQSGQCSGTCATAGEACVLAAAGGCVCSASVCHPCYITVNGFCDPNTSCQTSDECTTVPNEFCFTDRCPAIECPCCPVCGNGVCELDEGRCNCPQDCGSTGCFPGVPTCGDGFCQVNGTPGESHETCPQDCRLACRACP